MVLAIKLFLILPGALFFWLLVISLREMFRRLLDEN